MEKYYERNHGRQQQLLCSYHYHTLFEKLKEGYYGLIQFDDQFLWQISQYLPNYIRKYVFSAINCDFNIWNHFLVPWQDFIYLTGGAEQLAHSIEFLQSGTSTFLYPRP